MNMQIQAIIKKDIRAITANKRMCASLFIVPLVLTIVLPTIFILTLSLAPAEIEELKELLALLPVTEQGTDLVHTVLSMLLNYMMPVFFMIIPVMTASVMAGTAFVGEKEKHTLETLLYSPLNLSQIFRAKVLASFWLSMFVSLISFGVMMVVLELEAVFLLGRAVMPGVSWIVVLALVSPAVSIIAVTCIVRFSAKAKSVEDAQQGAVFLLLPILVLLVSQFTGLMLINVWILLAIGAGCAVLAFVFLRRAAKRISYERMLK